MLQIVVRHCGEPLASWCEGINKQSFPITEISYL
jgi:hypothetical protein